MDSDLPLLDISGEDDSLIQQTPTLRNDAVKVTDAFFSLSPLQLPISPINQSMKNNVAPKRPGCSSPKISNKENMDFNKAEGPRLTPHQMKRRKKGYNLRKSLAWDKAFFTEEGVLDPDELSLISGTYGNSRGEALSAISEERTKSPYSSSKYTFASENLQALSASKNRNNGGLLMPQHNLLAADSKGVHSNSGSSCNRSGAKSGRCPRPFPSSSLKRAAHVHNTKSAMKVPHLQKFPDHKSGPHSLLKASKSSMLGTSQLKNNQIAHPINTHKSISLESSCKNVKSTQNKEKSGPKCTQLPAKASAQPSRENMVNSSLEVNLLTNPPSSQIRKPDRSSEANLKPIISSGTELSGDGLYRPKAVAGLPPRSTSITVGNESQLQKVKPSGLRMPSPSLGYFAQNNAQPSNIPKCTAIGSRKSVCDFRALHAPKNTSMDIPENSVTVGLSSSMQCSELAASKAAMHKATKSDLMVSNIKKGNIPLLPDKSSEPKRSKHKVHGDIGTEENIGKHGKHENTEEIAYELDANVQITNDLMLLESGTCKKSQEDNHGRRVYTQCQNQKIDLKISLCKPENISTSSDMIDGQLVNLHNITNIKKELSTSSYNLEPQNHCLGFEQTFQCTPAICSEESQGKEVNVINEFVILERNEVGKSELSGSEVISAISLARSLDGEFDTSLMTEQPPLEAQSGFVEASLPIDTICSEESQGKEVNVINEFVILERNEVGKSESSGSEVISAISLARSLDGEFDSLMTEQPPLEAQSGFVEASLPIEIQDSSTGPHSRHEVEPIDNTTSSNVGKPFLCEVSGSWVQYDQASLNVGDKSEAHSFRNDGIMECVATDFFLDGSGEGKTVDASHIECVDGVVKESSTLRASTGSEADCSQHVSQIQNFKRTHEDTGGLDLLTSKSRVKLSQLQHMNITATTEQFREESNLSCSDLVNGQLLNHTKIYNFKSKSSTSSDNLEIQSPCLEVEQNSQCNPALCSEKFQGKEANASTDFVIQENNEVSRSESNGSEVILALSVAGSQSGEFDMNQITEQPDLKSQFGFVEVSPAVEIQDCSIGTHFGHQVEPVDTATSFSGGKHLLGVVSGSWLQCDQASLSEGGESDAHSFNNDAIMECVENDSCLDCTGNENTVDASQIEYTGRIVEESSTFRASSESEAKCFQHLSQFHNFERTHDDRSGVDILTSKSHVKISHQQDMNFTLTTEQYRERSNLSSLGTISDPFYMDSAEAYMKDKDASTSTKQPKRGTNIHQHDAVPFSNAVDGAREEHADPFVELPESVKPFACDAKQAPYVESHSLGCDISKDTSRKMGVNDLKDLSSSETEQNSNEFLYKRKHSEQENEAKTIVPQLSTSSDLIEGQLRDHSDNFYSKSKSYILLDTFELQSPCLRVEQNYQCNPELHSKEFRGEKVNGSKQFVIQERSDSKSEINGSEVIFAPSPARSKDAEFDSNRLTEQPPLKEQIDLVEVSPAVDVQDCSTDIHIRSEVVPLDSATSLDAAKPFLGEMSCSLVPYEQASIHEGGECDAHSSRNNVIMECFAADSCLNDTAIGQTVESFQNENTGRIVEESSVLQASSGSEAKCFKHSEFENLEREHDDTNGVDNLSSKSHVKISHWQHKNIIASTEQLKAESSGSGTVSDKCSGDSGHAYIKDSDATLSMKESERSTKPNSLIIPPPDAVPFSDEWLAAIEAAGEDILTKKSGAVQNSPPEKSLPEPSPWSPVKRKTNEIGPFDCTKYTNTQPADS